MADSALDIGTLSGSIDIGDKFSSVFDTLSARVGAAGSALDNISARATGAGKEIGDGMKNAGEHATAFGGAFEGSMHKVSESSHEAAAKAAETKKSFMEMFEDPVAAMKEFAHEMESSILGSLGLLGIGVAAATGAIAGLTFGIVEMGQSGGKISGVEKAFDKLAESAGTTGTALREALSEGVKGTITEMELMQSTTRLLGSGMKLTTDQATLMGEAARALGKATGGDAASGLALMSSALLTGRVRGLQQQIGLVDLAAGEKKFADSLGVAVTQLNAEGQLEGKRIAIFDATQKYLDKLGVSQVTWTEQLKQGRTAIANWTEDLEKSIARSPNITAAVNAIGDAIVKAFGGAGQTAAETILSLINKFADQVAIYGPKLVAVLAGIKDSVKELFAFIDEHKVILENAVLAVLSYQTAWGVFILGGELISGVTAGLAAIKIAVFALTESLAVEGLAGVGSTLTEIVSGPIGWTVLAITALSAAIFASIKYWSELKSGVTAAWIAIKNETQITWGVITKVFDAVIDSGIVRLTIAIEELILKIAGWDIALIGTILWKGFTIELGHAVEAVRDLKTLFGQLFDVLEKLAKVTFMETLVQAAATINLIATAIGKMADGMEKIASYIPSPLSSSLPTPTLMSRGTIGISTLPSGLSGSRVGGGPAPAVSEADRSRFLKDTKEAADAAAAAIAKTEGLWDQYYQIQAKMSGDDLGAKMADIDRWAEKEMASLDISKIGQKAYYEEVAAISSVAFMKRLEAEKTFTEEQQNETEKRIEDSRSVGTAAAAAISKSFLGPQTVLKDFLISTGAVPISLHSILAPAQEMGKVMTDVTVTAKEHFDDLHDAITNDVTDIAEKMRAQGVLTRDDLQRTADQFKTDYDAMAASGLFTSTELTNAWNKYIDAIKSARGSTSPILAELGSAFGSLGNEILQISQISQGTFSSVVKDIGLAVKAAETLSKALQITAVFGDIKGAGGPGGSNANVGGATGGLATSGLGAGTATALSGSTAAIAGETAAVISMVGAWVAVGIAVYSFISALREAGKEADKLALVAAALNKADVAFKSGTNFSDQLAQSLSDTTVDFEHITALNTKFTSSLARLQQTANSAGVSVEELSKMLGISATVFMDDLAQAAHLTDIIKELGGISALTADQLKTVQDRAKDLFILINLGGPIGQNAIKTMDDTLIQFTTDLTKSGGLVSQFFLDMAAKAKAAGIDLKQVSAFQATQAQNAETGIVKALTSTNDAYAKRKDLQQQIADATDALKGKTGSALDDAKAKLDDLNKQLTTQQKIIDAVGIHSQAAAGAVAGALLGVISSQVDAGMSFGDAIRAAGPGIQALRDQLATLGGGGGQAFDFLNQQITLFTDEVTGPALQSIEGYADGLVGLHNAGQLNQDTFAGITEQIGKTAEALIAQGTSGPALISAMQSPLQKIWELEQKFGYAADASTQALVDQAVADGIVGEKHKSVADQMLDMTDRMTKAIEFLAGAFGYVAPAAEDAAGGVIDAFGKIPGAAKTATDDANLFLSKLKAPPINIEWKYTDPFADPSLPADAIVEQPIYRASGGPVGTDTVPAWLSKGEYVLSTNDVSAISKFGVSSPTSTSNSQVASHDPYKNYPPVEIHVDARGAWFDDQGIEELSQRIQKPFWTAVHQNDQYSQTMAQNALKLNE